MFFEDITFENKNNIELFNITDSFMLGNSFKNEYKGYKNYSVNYLSAKDEKGSLMLKIYELDFAINDLALYLDLHPENHDMYKHFRECTNELNRLVSMYEKKYGPLELNESNYESFEWVKGKWPFEGGNL